MQKRITIIVAAVLTITIIPSLFTGCDCGGGGGGDGSDVVGVEYPQTYDPSVSGPANIDAALILPVGWAWIDTYQPGERDGFSFAVDGTFRTVYDDVEGGWLISNAGVAATSASADTLTVESGWLYPGIDQGRALPYALSAAKDTLTLTIGDQPEIFIRTSDVNPTAILSKRRSDGKREKVSAVLGVR